MNRASCARGLVQYLSGNIKFNLCLFRCNLNMSSNNEKKNEKINPYSPCPGNNNKQQQQNNQQTNKQKQQKCCVCVCGGGGGGYVGRGVKKKQQ